jgi:tRNA (guanine-N7-)-methyltransferase
MIQRREIRSFMRREGRMGDHKRLLLNELWPHYGVDLTVQSKPLDVFKRVAPCVLEIGFGNGDALAFIAEKQPEKNFLGVDVFRPGIAQLLKKIHAQLSVNVAVIEGDGKEVLLHHLPSSSLHGVHLFFPDPWPKKKHRKRRLVNDSFAELVADRLEMGGYFHMATDWQNYADQMKSVLARSDRFQNVSTQDDGYSQKPDYRPDTKYEKRGIRLKHDVRDLIYRKCL